MPMPMPMPTVGRATGLRQRRDPAGSDGLRSPLLPTTGASSGETPPAARLAVPNPPRRQGCQSSGIS